MDVLLGALAFLGGLVTKPIMDLISEVVRQRILRQQAKADTAMQQADRASERCLEAIGIYARDGFRYLWSERQQGPTVEGLRERLQEAAALLDANIVLLHPDARKPMTLVMEVLGAADQLDHSSGAPWAHYDDASTMLRESIEYGRKVLGSQLHRERLPSVPERMTEYSLALKDRERWWEEDGVDPDALEAHERFRRSWLQDHRGDLRQLGHQETTEDPG